MMPLELIGAMCSPTVGGRGGVKVEIKAISAQPTEVGVRLSWAELGKIIFPLPLPFLLPRHLLLRLLLTSRITFMNWVTG